MTDQLNPDPQGGESNMDAKQVPVGRRGHFALVSPEDYDRVAQASWHLQKAKLEGQFYASTTNNKGGGIGMHRFILGLQTGDGLMVDHINLNKLDNRRENLRIATAAQNNMNCTARKSSTSGLKGAHKYGKKWQAKIKFDGKQVCLGTFSTPEEAHAAYCDAAVVHHGEYVNLGSGVTL